MDLQPVVELIDTINAQAERIATLTVERDAFGAQCTTYKSQIGHLHERIAALEAENAALKQSIADWAFGLISAEGWRGVKTSHELWEAVTKTAQDMYAAIGKG